MFMYDAVEQQYFEDNVQSTSTYRGKKRKYNKIVVHKVTQLKNKFYILHSVPSFRKSTVRTIPV